MAKSAKQDAGRVIATASRINQLHTNLTRSFGELLTEPVTILDRAEREFIVWRQTQSGELEFFMRAVDRRRQASALKEHGSADRTPIVRLPIGETRRKPVPLAWWVAWRETWVAEGAEKFSFKTAGCSLYCSTDDVAHQLLLRAEWDWPDPEKPMNAGQPHWHIHRVLDLVGSESVSLQPRPASHPVDTTPTPFTGAVASAVATDGGLVELEPGEPIAAADAGLVELSEMPVARAEITRVHLGMGGWDNHATTPRAWQRSLDGDVIKTLSEWAPAAMRYVQSQLPYVK